MVGSSAETIGLSNGESGLWAKITKKEMEEKKAGNSNLRCVF